MQALEPIHQAAWNGDADAVVRLIEEDGRRLNMETRLQLVLPVPVLHTTVSVKGLTPLLLAVLRGREAVVERLLQLGADAEVFDQKYGRLPVHWACLADLPAILSMLLDAGAAPDDYSITSSSTPLMMAAEFGAGDCVAVLLSRGGDALDLDKRDMSGRTALHRAAGFGRARIVQQLLQAGADPTARDFGGSTALDYGPRHFRRFLGPAVAEPRRTRSLFKARALLEAPLAVRTAARCLAAKGIPQVLHPVILALAAPFKCVNGRVEQEQELPTVDVGGREEGNGIDGRLEACVKYALGVAGGGGVVVEGQAPAPGMPRKAFVQLLELMVPKWDPARNGRPLGVGYFGDLLAEIGDWSEGDGDSEEEGYESEEEEEDDEDDDSDEDDDNYEEEDEEDEDSEYGDY